MARRQDFTSFIGEDLTLSVTMTPTTDITGWTFEFTARDPVGNATKFLEKLDAAFTIDNAAGGVFSVSISDTDTDTVSPTTGQIDYSIKRMDAGSETVLTYGVWTLTLPATRDNDS